MHCPGSPRRGVIRQFGNFSSNAKYLGPKIKLAISLYANPSDTSPVTFSRIALLHILPLLPSPENIGKFLDHEPPYEPTFADIVLKIGAAEKARFACSRLDPCQLQSRIVPHHGVRCACRLALLPSSAYLLAEQHRWGSERYQSLPSCLQLLRRRSICCVYSDPYTARSKASTNYAPWRAKLRPSQWDIQSTEYTETSS